jgi:hypothetical protein
MKYLVDDPTGVYVILAAAELILLVLWWHRRTAKLRLALLGPVVLGGAVFALDLFVQTDREQLLAAARDIAQAAKVGDVETAATYLDENYTGFGGSKEKILARTKTLQTRYTIETVKLTDFNMTLSNRQAQMNVTSVIHFGAGTSIGMTSLRWTLQWIEREDGWRISNIEEPQTAVPGFTR